MCVSTNNARTESFAAALAFFAAQTAKQVGDAAPQGPTRQHIALVQSFGGGEPPAEVVALADAEDAVLVQVREVQLAQQTILTRLLKGNTLIRTSEADNFVASLNNLDAAIKAADVAQAAYDVEAEKARPSLEALAALIGDNDETGDDAVDAVRRTLQ